MAWTLPLWFQLSLLSFPVELWSEIFLWRNFHFYSMTSDSSQVAAGSSAPVLRVDGDVFAKQCQLVLLELADSPLRLSFFA